MILQHICANFLYFDKTSGASLEKSVLSSHNVISEGSQNIQKICSKKTEVINELSYEKSQNFLQNKNVSKKSKKRFGESDEISCDLPNNKKRIFSKDSDEQVIENSKFFNKSIEINCKSKKTKEYDVKSLIQKSNNNLLKEKVWLTENSEEIDQKIPSLEEIQKIDFNKPINVVNTRFFTEYTYLLKDEECINLNSENHKSSEKVIIDEKATKCTQKHISKQKNQNSEPENQFIYREITKKVTSGEKPDGSNSNLTETAPSEKNKYLNVRSLVKRLIDFPLTINSNVLCFFTPEIVSFERLATYEHSQDDKIYFIEHPVEYSSLFVQKSLYDFEPSQNHNQFKSYLTQEILISHGNIGVIDDLKNLEGQEKSTNINSNDHLTFQNPNNYFENADCGSYIALTQVNSIDEVFPDGNNYNFKTFIMDLPEYYKYVELMSCFLKKIEQSKKFQKNLVGSNKNINLESIKKSKHLKRTSKELEDEFNKNNDFIKNINNDYHEQVGKNKNSRISYLNSIIYKILENANDPIERDQYRLIDLVCQALRNDKCIFSELGLSNMLYDKETQFRKFFECIKGIFFKINLNFFQETMLTFFKFLKMDEYTIMKNKDNIIKELNPQKFQILVQNFIEEKHMIFLKFLEEKIKYDVNKKTLIDTLTNVEYENIEFFTKDAFSVVNNQNFQIFFTRNFTLSSENDLNISDPEKSKEFKHILFIYCLIRKIILITSIFTKSIHCETENINIEKDLIIFNKNISSLTIFTSFVYQFCRRIIFLYLSQISNTITYASDFRALLTKFFISKLHIVNENSEHILSMFNQEDLKKINNMIYSVIDSHATEFIPRNSNFMFFLYHTCSLGLERIFVINIFLTLFSKKLRKNEELSLTESEKITISLYLKYCSQYVVKDDPNVWYNRVSFESNLVKKIKSRFK